MANKRIKYLTLTATRGDLKRGSFGVIDTDDGTKRVPGELLEPLGAMEVTDVSEYSFAVTDESGTFLFGLKADGSVEWAKGIPTPIISAVEPILDSLLNSVASLSSDMLGKVDKVEDMGLADATFGQSTQSTADFSSYLFSILDDSGNLLFSIDADGNIDWGKGIPTPVLEALGKKVSHRDGKDIIDSTFAEAVSSTDESSPVAFVLKSTSGAEIFSILEDGSIEWAKGVPQPIREALGRKQNFIPGKAPIDYEHANAAEHFDDTEFAWGIVNADGVVLVGVRHDGSVYSDGILSIIEDKFATDSPTRDYVDEQVGNEKARAESAEASLASAINNITPVVVVGGTNNPDNVFLANYGEEGSEVITLKDTQRTIAGMSVKYIRPDDDLVAVMTAPNTIYEIRHSFSIANGPLVMPSNCVLRFNGGAIVNGEIVGSSTRVEYTGEVFGAGVTISGTWEIPYIFSSICADIQQAIKLTSHTFYNVFHIVGTHEWLPPVNSSAFLSIRANTKVILDGTLKVRPNGFTNYYVLNVVENAKNVEICGGGKIEGDADEHDYTTTQSTHEWGFGVWVRRGCLNVDVHGIEIKNMTGDAVCANGENINIHDMKISHCGRQGVSLIVVKNVEVYNLDVADIYRTAPMAAVDVEPNPGDGYAENVHIHNILMRNCRGIQGIYNKNILIDTITAENCSMLLFARDAHGVKVDGIRYTGTTTGSPKFVWYDECENVVLDNLYWETSQPTTILWEGAKLGPSIELVGSFAVDSEPEEGSVRYDKANHKYQVYNGTTWENI